MCARHPLGLQAGLHDQKRGEYGMKSFYSVHYQKPKETFLLAKFQTKEDHKQ